MAMFKQALKDYFVYEEKELMYLKNEPKRIRARCAEEGCPWLVFCSHNSQSLSFQIKTFIGEHNCGRNLSSNMADRAWVTSKLVKRLVTQPLMTPKEALEHMKQDYNVHINYRMIYRALKAAREQAIGKEREQYGKLHDYLNEIHRSNPGSTGMVDVIPQLEGRPLFNRLYISLDACKKGFKVRCRPLIGLDGCFLKGYFGGHLLSAVGQDANNSFFVIAFTGLAKALHEVMPQAHHRNCVLHIWKNFIKNFKDKHTKGLVWKAAKSTTMREFKDSMELVKKVNKDAWEYLRKFDPGAWTKAYFSHGPKCDNITNNMCEVWNAKIVEYREKPILTMCEELRSYIMRKMAGHKHRISKCKGKLAPVQQLRLDEYIIPESNKWTAEWTGDEAKVLFEVQRLPCKHAVAAISRLRKQGLRPEDFAHKWLTIEAVRVTYRDSIKPMNSEEFWKETNRLRPEAPIIRRAPRRPTKKRAVDVVAESQMQQQGHKARKSFQVTCSKCGQKGHYHMTCKGPPANLNWQPKRKKAKQQQIGNQSSQLPPDHIVAEIVIFGFAQAGEGVGSNVPQNVTATSIDPVSKAKRQKKKVPKTSNTHSVQQETRIDTQSSHPAQPPVEGVDYNTELSNHTTPTTLNHGPNFRPKQAITRPPAPTVYHPQQQATAPTIQPPLQQATTPNS
ncbi:uncharacterized protein LOC130965081 [Arachis stenosperma]|uniref:uncharacterized protein LOC130965081 n=1 Tax=Arachis stenosperma TaxID=217475 RepID=UPI0025AD78D7|nr:uncharacterized protein LOC130965081 [Arachis stenosperma]